MTLKKNLENDITKKVELKIIVKIILKFESDDATIYFYKWDIYHKTDWI